MTESMDMVHTHGLMADSTKENGRMVNNTEMAHTVNQVDKKEKVYGKMAKDYNGLMNEKEIFELCITKPPLIFYLTVFKLYTNMLTS